MSNKLDELMENEVGERLEEVIKVNSIHTTAINHGGNNCRDIKMVIDSL